MFSLLKKNQPKEGSHKLTLKISGMHCTSCAMNIDDALEEVDGILSSNTSYAKSTTIVESKGKKVDVKKILSVIEQEGYQAEVVE